MWENFDTVYDNRDQEKYKSSVIIVLYKTPKDILQKNINILCSEIHQLDSELVIVNNGVDFSLENHLDNLEIPAVVIETYENVGAAPGRDLGTSVANGELLIFLDDDAIPSDDFVESHIIVHEAHDIVACRGRAEPISDSIVNYLQSHYHLGNEPCESILNLEGNLSIRRSAYQEADGFKVDLEGRTGHEGAILTYDLLQSGYRIEEVIYHPRPVIYHDYADSVLDYLDKADRQGTFRNELSDQHPEIVEFIQNHPQSDNRTKPLSITERICIKMIGLTENLWVRM